jgi:hypothetical protein
MQLIEIRSRPGIFIKFDDEVAKVIGHWGWCLRTDGYPVARIPKSGKHGVLARCSRAVIWAITGKWPEKGMEVDHIHHDLLDNRMSELRVVTKSLNGRNLIFRNGGKSKYKGVSFNKIRDGWFGHVGIRVETKLKIIYAALTKNEEEAARARDCIADWIGDFMLPNFPNESFAEKWEKIGECQRKKIFKSFNRNDFLLKERGRVEVLKRG